MDSVEVTAQRIAKDLSYQSSLELAQETYETIRIIPTMHDITAHSRQQLVQRLDDYQELHTKSFKIAVSVIEERFVSVLRRHSLSDLAIVKVKDDHLKDISKNIDLGVEMIIDILTDRGFTVTHEPMDRNENRFTLKFRRT